MKTFCVKDSADTKKKAVSESKSETTSAALEKCKAQRAARNQPKEQSSPQLSSAASWKFLIKRAPACLHTTSPPASQSLTCFLPMVLFFAPTFLLVPVWLPQRNSRESASICRGAGAERHGQPQCLSLTHSSTRLFRKQENIEQRGRNQQRNKKQNQKSSRTDA